MLFQANELNRTIEYYKEQLDQLDEVAADLKTAPGKWSKKEILGHLIDSAQNNLRRFIVAQYEESPTILYQQDDWVRLNNYQGKRLEDVIELWYLTNKQIVGVLENTDRIAAKRTCNVGTLQTINWLGTDYIKHLKHHLHQILNLEAISYP